MYYFWNKNKNIEYKELNIECKNCGNKIDTVIESKDKYEYKCKKCKKENYIIKKEE